MDKQQRELIKHSEFLLYKLLSFLIDNVSWSANKPLLTQEALLIESLYKLCVKQCVGGKRLASLKMIKEVRNIQLLKITLPDWDLVPANLKLT